ncbi:putative phage protein (predicted DNA packaging) [Rhodopseudomonas rhenobacensis]|uniref:Putative phage protein (Predicted DNA packaging) n=1 Tax=Rhodopseudomonas rhenobacensis TaxID=87461 RepID=A0A7W7Z186_9BRAD|nr:head-tail connector protein [Rhodopseudomonas rhenobacensis]MBB5045931.1 putative phage protein (predicted DNA packaging) [Rhodopseudomonas rhenobacensis]MBB5046164.1 putative phage protein (predicted DNA packaging) [Rhodopseudomonas rhenobacensis]
MAIVTLEEVKAQLNQTLDVDDELIERKICAAQCHIEQLLGFKISDQYTPTKIPAPLKECVCQLAAHWYENREAVLVGVTAQSLPIGVSDIVNEYRNWSWAG